MILDPGTEHTSLCLRTSLMILDPGTEHTSLCLLCGQASSLPTTATSEAPA